MLLCRQNPQNKSDGRGQVLQDTDGGQVKSFGCGSKPDQWQTGNNTRSGHPKGQFNMFQKKLSTKIILYKIYAAAGTNRTMVSTTIRVWVRLVFFSGIAVKSKRKCECQGKHGQSAIGDKRIDHTDQCKKHSNTLNFAESLTQQEVPDQDIDHGIDIITKACFHYPARVHRPDIYKPVNPDQKSA